MTSLVEEFYCLKRPPFLHKPGHGPVLMTEPLRDAARFVRDGLANHVPILSVLGGAGIGKSSFARALPKIVGDEFKVAQFSGRSESWEEFAPTLAREFQLDAQRITREELEAIRDQVGRPLIVVDDAQHLSPLLLERICILPQLLTTFGEPVVQVVLLADLDSVRVEEVRPLLAWMDVDARHQMEALPLADAHRYIDTRLRRAGWEGQPLVCEAGATAIHRISLGNPRRLGEACTDVLEQASARGLKRIDSEFVIECLSETRTHLMGEPLLVAPGTPLCEEPAVDAEENKDDFPFATVPLTAENINQSESLQLEDEELEAEYKALGYPSAGGVSTVGDSMGCSFRGVSRKQFPTLRPKRRTNGRPSIAAFVLMIVAAVALYSVRTDVAELFQQIGLNVPFLSESTEPVDVVESPEAHPESDAPATLRDALSIATKPDGTQITVPVPNETTDSEFAARIPGGRDEWTLARN